jgi:hypothetical protein
MRTRSKTRPVEGRVSTDRAHAVVLRFFHSVTRDPTQRFGALDSGPRLDILEQNYQYDLLSPQKLLEKYVGRNVKLYR